MANSNFIVQNGLQVGPLTIDAATGSISTTGTVNVSGLATSAISQNDSSVSISDSGTGSNVRIIIDGVTEHTIDANGVNLASGDAYSINGSSVLSATTLGSGVLASSLTSLGTIAALTATGATATTLTATNFSTGNAVLSGGSVNGTTVGASTASTGRFTTITGTSSTDSTSASTGAMILSGGLGVAGNVWVGGNLYVSNIFSVTTNTLTVNDPLVYFTSTPSPYNFDIGFYSAFVGGPSNLYGHSGMVRSQASNVWILFSNIASEPSTTGVNWNDAGIIYDAMKAGALTLANTTAATSTTSGALQVAGGAGIAGALYAGSLNSAAGVITTGVVTNFSTGNAQITGGSLTGIGTLTPSANASVNLGSSTAWWSTIYGVATQAKYADLAENYQADKAYMPGQVLEFGGEEEVTLATPDSKRVAGVVSTNPAHLMNGGLTGPNVAAIALTGRVPCNVIGPVSKGDLMVSAGFGYAKADNNPEIGQVIGKSLVDFTGAKGQIEVVVGRF